MSCPCLNRSVQNMRLAQKQQRNGSQSHTLTHSLLLSNRHWVRAFTLPLFKSHWKHHCCHSYYELKSTEYKGGEALNELYKYTYASLLRCWWLHRQPSVPRQREDGPKSETKKAWWLQCLGSRFTQFGSGSGNGSMRIQIHSIRIQIWIQIQAFCGIQPSLRWLVKTGFVDQHWFQCGSGSRELN